MQAHVDDDTGSDDIDDGWGGNNGARACVNSWETEDAYKPGTTIDEIGGVWGPTNNATWNDNGNGTGWGTAQAEDFGRGNAWSTNNNAGAFPTHTETRDFYPPGYNQGGHHDGGWI